MVGAVWLARITTREPAPDPARRAPLRTEIADGVRFVFGKPVLRAIALPGACRGAAQLGANQAVLLPFLVRTSGLSAGAVGVLYTLGQRRRRRRCAGDHPADPSGRARRGR